MFRGRQALALVISLRGSALNILEIVRMRNKEKIRGLRFGQVQLKHAHQVEFKHRNKKPNEILREYEADVA